MQPEGEICYPLCYPETEKEGLRDCKSLILLARPERLELPTTWFEVFHLGSCILLLDRRNFENRCPIKLAYLPVFCAVWVCLSASIGQIFGHR
jgi:hypothetical protein